MKGNMKSIELFFAAGLAVSLAACTEPTATESATDATAQAPAVEDTVVSQGGEGGEGGEGGSAYGASSFDDKLSGAELATALQGGGYIIYFRHAQTEKDYADQVTADPNNCSTQRTLSEVGWQQSQAIGEGFESANIPIGKVMSSEYCRAWQTAAIAFGRYEKNADLNFLPYEDYTDEQVQQMKETMTPLLTAVPDSGSNTVIVGHDDLFEAATGIYPEPQGMAHVLKPDGAEFEIIADVLPDEWQLLAN